METTWRLWALALAATASATAVSESDADLCPHTTHPGLIPHPLDCEDIPIADSCSETVCLPYMATPVSVVV